MPTLSNKETALLMLLSEQPMHAYQIEKIVEQRAMREWTEISMSSIYKLLRKLEARRLISSRQQQSERYAKVGPPVRGESDLVAHLEIGDDRDGAQRRDPLSDRQQIPTCFAVGRQEIGGGFGVPLGDIADQDDEYSESRHD